MKQEVPNLKSSIVSDHRPIRQQASDMSGQRRDRSHPHASSTLLALCGILLMAMGLYFVLVRPALLPEDLRFLGTSLTTLQATIPLLPTWLNKVFWVMGAYIFTSGLLTLYLARTSFRSRAKGIFPVVTLAGITSIGWMTMVNFLINSDFRWALLVLALLWGSALVLYHLEK